MGVRIYPQTRNESILEALAEVPQGTMARLNEVRKRHEEVLRSNPTDAWKMREDQWKEIHDDGNLSALDTFLTFGWGKFTSEAWSVLKGNIDKCSEGSDTDAGDSTDASFCKNLLQAQGVWLGGLQVEKLEGLSWG